MKRIILASSSIYRQEVLKIYCPDFLSISPDIDETPNDDEKPMNLALRLSLSKAKKISEEYPDHFIIGSDQVGSFEGKILGKPGNYANALDNFKSFYGKSVYFHAGVSFINKSLKIERSKIETTEIQFKKFSDLDMKQYLDNLDTFNTTAGVKSESIDFLPLVKKIIARDRQAILGLPINWVVDQLTEFNQIT